MGTMVPSRGSVDIVERSNDSTSALLLPDRRDCSSSLTALVRSVVLSEVDGCGVAVMLPVSWGDGVMLPVMLLVPVG